jgi:hypothetical protein
VCSAKAIAATTLCGKHREYYAARVRTAYVPSESTPVASISWDDWPLGKLSDTEIARLIGVTRPTVARERERRGISAYQRTT